MEKFWGVSFEQWETPKEPVPNDWTWLSILANGGSFEEAKKARHASLVHSGEVRELDRSFLGRLKRCLGFIRLRKSRTSNSPNAGRAE